MVIQGYAVCSCGAITIYTNSGDFSCKKKNLHKFFPGIDLRRLHRYPTMDMCNHCVNHYGLDLCGCGSGEDFGECTNYMDACKMPMQMLGEYTRVVGKDAWIA